MVKRFWIPVLVALAGVAAVADEGMWRLDQLPRDTIARAYGVRLTDADVQNLHYAPVRILMGGGGGTGTFASANGLVLTNHHVALDCIRTSTLAEQNGGRADNLIEQGFTAASPAAELPCKRFRVQIERESRDVTSELNADVTPGMAIEAVQRARQTKRSDLERACQQEKGDAFSCDVVDFNSGARSLLITYEDFNDIRLVYAPEKQLGYFGGDEMNFRFPGTSRTSRSCAFTSARTDRTANTTPRTCRTVPTITSASRWRASRTAISRSSPATLATPTGTG